MIPVSSSMRLMGARHFFGARAARTKDVFGGDDPESSGLLRERVAADPGPRKAHFVSRCCVPGRRSSRRGRGARRWKNPGLAARGTAGFGYDPAFQPDDTRVPSAR